MSKYCRECGKELNEKAVICVHCGCQVKENNKINTEKNKWVALLLWFFFGGFGGHKFYVNNIGGAVGYIICFTVGWLLFAIPPMIASIFIIIDLVKILKGNLDGVELN